MPSKRTTLVDKRARALCAKLAPLNDGTPMDYREVLFMAQVLDCETADAAIFYAIQKGWLIGVGEPPHSVRLTDDGRMASAQGRRR
jgi:hypothetical protein